MFTFLLIHTYMETCKFHPYCVYWPSTGLWNGTIGAATHTVNELSPCSHCCWQEGRPVRRRSTYEQLGHAPLDPTRYGTNLYTVRTTVQADGPHHSSSNDLTNIYNTHTIKHPCVHWPEVMCETTKIYKYYLPLIIVWHLQVNRNLQ